MGLTWLSVSGALTMKQTTFCCRMSYQLYAGSEDLRLRCETPKNDFNSFILPFPSHWYKLLLFRYICTWWSDVCVSVDCHSYRRADRTKVLRVDARETWLGWSGKGDLLWYHKRSHVGHPRVQKHQGRDHFYPRRQQNGRRKCWFLL